MKKYLIAFILSCSTFQLFSQNTNQNWTWFIEKETDLIGYKDSLGNVVIKPKFESPTHAKIFENIIAVYEKANLLDKKDYSYKKYHLLKNGKKVGIDSLYIFDFTLDCESENKIRFRDPKTDLVGFFDQNGNITIPAIYNNAQPFRNGLSLVISNAKKICWEGGELSESNPCEHWSYEGNLQIINTKNEVILDSLSFENIENIDWYSFQKNPVFTDSTKIMLKGDDGNIYAFDNIRKKFENWFYEDFLKDTNQERFLRNSLDQITISKNGNIKSDQFNNPFYNSFAWTKDKKENVYLNNKDFIISLFEIIKNKKLKIGISEGFTPLFIDENFYPIYLNNCGEYQNTKFPYFEVYLTKDNGNVIYRMAFMRTKDGYKLIELA